MTPAVVKVTVEVSVNPQTAFDIFVAEIDRWWRPGPINWYDAYSAVGTRIEPGVGGRWLEFYAEPEIAKEIARVTVWEPGARLSLRYCDGDVNGTEIDIHFDAVDDHTRVTLEHRGWELLDPGKAARKVPLKQRGWTNILGWYVDWADWSSPLRIRGRSEGGLAFVRGQRRAFERTLSG